MVMLFFEMGFSVQLPMNLTLHRIQFSAGGPNMLKLIVTSFERSKLVK